MNYPLAAVILTVLALTRQSVNTGTVPTINLTKDYHVVSSSRSISIIKPRIDPVVEVKLVVETRATISRERTISSAERSGDVAGKAEKLYHDSTNNCVRYSKQQTGISRSIGAGGRAGINSQIPEVGVIGSLKGSPHAVVVEKIYGDLITFRESNYQKGWITRRSLPRSQFIGFIK